MSGSSFRNFFVIAAAIFLVCGNAAIGQSTKPVPLGKAVHNGLAVEFSMEPLSPEKNDLGHVREQQNVVVRFAISDAASGTPLRGAYPAAWMDLLPAGQEPDAKFCSARTKALLDGSVFSKAELDLNSYYVLVLNQDATISVVDPLFGFGNSKLLNLISLAGRGEDWALSSDQQKLFISMPDAGQVAVIDTASWKPIKNIDVGPRPTRIALQPDQQYLWVAYGESTPATSGVAVINTSELRAVEHIKSGSGVHDLAFSSDSHVAFVTNSAAGSISVIDIRSLKKVSDLATGDEPVSIAFSTLSQRAYATHKDGTIAVIDGVQGRVASKVQSKAGLGQIRFAPEGRWGFVLNPEKNELQILDASSGRIVQSGKMDEGPDQVDFSEKLAYIRHRGSGDVLMVPLGDIGAEGKPLAPADFTGGQHPFGAASRKTPADGIVKAPGANAVLVANPADKSVYYYEEGMAAPKGQFSNYGREALAVMVVDRSLKDHAPGVYEAVARLTRPGHYVVPFVMLSPQVVHCFEVTVEPAPSPTVAVAQPPKVELLLTGKRTMKTGQPMHLRFRLVNPQTHEPLQNLQDVRVLTVLSPGLHPQRQAAVAEGPGIYAVDFIPSEPGTYLAYVECLSHGLTFNNPQGVALHAEDSGAGQ
ncbi:MAG TPA: YncE family protein [Candidatus Angelobacter sp.]|nr:YncE family protein [Candidatus Angelobacter sp.]